MEWPRYHLMLISKSEQDMEILLGTFFFSTIAIILHCILNMHMVDMNRKMIVLYMYKVLYFCKELVNLFMVSCVHDFRNMYV